MDERQHEGHGEQVPGLGDGTLEAQCVEWCPICRTMDVLRASTTPEVREQWQQVQREAVLTLRTLVDHYAERLAEDGTSSRDPGATGNPAKADAGASERGLR